MDKKTFEELDKLLDDLKLEDLIKLLENANKKMKIIDKKIRKEKLKRLDDLNKKR